MNLGKAIKDLRKNKGLNQSELAEAAGITQTTLSQIENGKRPGIVTLKNISKALQIPESLIYIAGIEKDDVPEHKQILYDKLFPVVKSLVMQIGNPDT